MTDPIQPSVPIVLSTRDYDVIAGGHDIYDAADGFTFLYEQKTGDFDVKVQVSRLDLANHWSKAGLMIREKLTANSRNLSAVVDPRSSVAAPDNTGTGANVYEANYRSVESGTTGAWPGGAINNTVVPYPTAWIRLARTGDTYTAYRGTNGLDWTVYAQCTLTGAAAYPSNVYVGLATTSHRNATNANSLTYASYRNYQASGPSLPLIAMDIGIYNTTNNPPTFLDPLMPGRNTVLNNSDYDVTAGGHDIWDTADGFNFLYEAKTGDFDVKVQVARLDIANNWSKAGLMLRENFTGPSRNINLVVDPSGTIPEPGGTATGANRYEPNYRNVAGGASAGWTSVSNNLTIAYPNVWMRFQRVGQSFSAYRGTNGTDWAQIGAMTLTGTNTFPNSAYLGLCLTAHNNATNVSTFAQFRSYGPTFAAGAPKLTATLSGGNVVISWLAAGSEGYTLQSATSLTAPVTWSAVADVTSGANRTATVPITGIAKFFELKK